MTPDEAREIAIEVSGGHRIPWFGAHRAERDRRYLARPFAPPVERRKVRLARQSPEQGVYAPDARGRTQDTVALGSLVDAAQEPHRFSESRVAARSRVRTRSSRIRRAPSYPYNPASRKSLGERHRCPRATSGRCRPGLVITTSGLASSILLACPLKSGEMTTPTSGPRACNSAARNLRSSRGAPTSSTTAPASARKRASGISSPVSPAKKILFPLMRFRRAPRSSQADLARTTSLVLDPASSATSCTKRAVPSTPTGMRVLTTVAPRFSAAVAAAFRFGSITPTTVPSP